MFSCRGDLTDCKLALGQAVLRLKRERIVKEEEGKKIRTEIAQQLKAGMEAKAFVMGGALLKDLDGSVAVQVQQMLIGQRRVVGYNILIYFCNLILDRLDLLQISRECPPDLKQAVASLIYAAPSCANQEQLLKTYKLLAKKFSAVAAAARSLAPNCEVHPTIRDGFQGPLPTHAQQAWALGEIARECKLSWSHHLPESEAQASVPARTEPSRGLEGSPKLPEARQMTATNGSRPPSAAESRGASYSTPLGTPGNSRVGGESGRGGRVVEVVVEATLLPSMDEWMGVEGLEGSLPVYLEESDDDDEVDGEGGVPSTPQTPSGAEGAHHYAHAEAEAEAEAEAGASETESGVEREVGSGGGVPPKSSERQSGEKQQQLKSNISKTMSEIGQLLEEAKRRRESHGSSERPVGPVDVGMDTSPGSTCSSGGVPARESAETRSAERGRSGGEGREERWPEALDYGKDRGRDRMVRDANGEDEEYLSGFEDLEDFFTKQKKRAVEARRRDRNEA